MLILSKEEKKESKDFTKETIDKYQKELEESLDKIQKTKEKEKEMED